MISALIAAALYGNIGIKGLCTSPRNQPSLLTSSPVLYNNIFVELLKAPALSTKTGKMIWAGMIPIYWSIAFVIAAGIPDFSGLTSIVSAVCILQFTYTFPPMLAIAYQVKKNAMLPDEGFDPATGRFERKDSGIKRIVRGFMKNMWYVNALNVVYMLGAIAMAGLGSYGAIENLIHAFQNGATNSFECKSPLQ